MNEPRRELLLASLVALLVLTGVVTDLARDEVSGAALPPVEGERFVERSLFCPPTPSEGAVGTEVSVVAPSGEPVSTRVGAAPVEEIPADTALVRALGSRDPVTVTGYGARIDAGGTTAFGGKYSGASAALCAPTASEHWFFPEGSSLLDFEERLLIYNPFPEEAVVKITFFLPGGDVSKANLADVPVPAGEWTSVPVKEYILSERILGAEIVALRGRVVAWRTVLAAPEDRPAGVYSTLGAIDPAPTWYLPDGGVGEGLDTRVAILNPSDEEARVTISLIAGDGLLQPRKLSELKIRARAAQSFALADMVSPREAEAGSVSILVQTTNGVDVFAEATTWFETDVTGVSSEIGATDASETVVVPPAVGRAARDVLYIVNPSADAVQLEITFLGPTGPVEPGALSSIEVPGGLRRKIPIADFTQGRPMVAIVRADAPVFVSRSAYPTAETDPAAVMGVPLDVR